MRRLISGIFASLLTIASAAPLFTVKAENEPVGQWVLVDTVEYRDTGERIDTDENNYKSISYDGLSMSHSCCIDEQRTVGSADSRYGYYELYSYLELTNKPAIADYFNGGEVLEFDLTAYCRVYSDDLTYDNDFWSTISLCDPSTPAAGFTDGDKSGEYVRVFIDENAPGTVRQISRTLTIPQGETVGEEFAISYRSTGCENRWVYRWETDEVPKEVAALGTWELVEQYLYTPEPDVYQAIDYRYTVSFGGDETSHLVKTTCEKLIDSLPNIPNATAAVTFSSAPPRSFTAGEHILIDVSLSETENGGGFRAGGVDFTSDAVLYYPYRGTYVSDNYYGIAEFLDFNVRDNGIVNGYSEKLQTAHIIAPIPTDSEKSYFCGIRYYTMSMLSNQDMPTMMYTDYIYEWKGDPNAVYPTDGEEGEEPATDISGESVDIVVTKEASSEKGEDKEGIPAIAIVGILGILGVGGAGAAAAAGVGIAAASKKSGKKKNDDKKNDDKKDDPTKSTFEMRIFKDFGDTLLVGQEVNVYARIVEVTENGSERDRNDLTARIRIYSPEYLRVSNEQMSGNYKAAVVMPLKGSRDEVPDTAEICFTLSGTGGSFTEKVIFNVCNLLIHFFQPNLTLAANYAKSHQLKFALVGTTSFTSVTAKMKGTDYSVEIAESNRGNCGVEYTATFTEKTSEELEVGEISQNVFMVRAEYIGPDKKKHRLEEDFYVYRMGMGVVLDLASIGCYFGKNGEPAVTKGHVMLLTWSETEHKIIRVAAPPTSFRVVHQFNSMGYDNVSDQSQREMNMINQLCVGMTVREDARVDPDKGLECDISCLNGILDAPQRLVADIEMSAAHNGIEYKTLKKHVLLESQPKRRFKTSAEEKAALDKDKQTEDGLKTMRAIIVEAGMDKQCHPIIEYIDLMLKNYEKIYGYDEQNITKLRRAYMSVMNAQKDQAQADADALDELSSTFLGKCSIVADYAKQCEDTMSIGQRLMIGVCTLGYSEAALTTCRVFRSVRDTIMEADSSESDLYQWSKALFYGSIDPVMEFGFAYLSDKGLTWAKGKYAKWKAGKTPNVSAINSSAKTMNGNVDKTITSKINAADGKKLFNAGDSSLKVHKEVTSAVDDAVKAMKTTALSEADEAFERGVEIGREKLFKLAAAEGDDFAQWAISVQSDKYAMSALKRMKGDAAVELRSKFNNFMISKNQEIIDMTRRKIAEQLGCPVEEIQVFKATAQKLKQLKSGLTTTFDLDVTYQQVTKDGKIFKISQYSAEKLHNESCYSVFNGRPAPNYEAAYKYAKGLDHSVVQSTSMENYGSEKVLETIIDSAKQGEVITGAEASRAAKTIEYKGLERLERAAEWMKKAATADTKEVYLSAVKAAQMEKAEGFRQIVKQADYLLSKDVIAMTRGSESAVSKPLRFAIETMRKVTDGALTPDAAEALIKSKCGLTPQDVCKATGELLKTINNNLSGSVKTPVAMKVAAADLRNRFDQRDE